MIVTQRVEGAPAGLGEQSGRKPSRAEAAARTREHILLQSMRLFATESYDGVSMRDIAGEIGIKSSSIYNYFAAKEELLREILERFERGCALRIARVRRAAGEEPDLGQFVELLFDQFAGGGDDAFCYGAVILLKEQFAVTAAGETALRLLRRDGVQGLCEALYVLVERKIIPPCDTRVAAALFIHGAMTAAGLSLHERLGNPVPVSSRKLMENLKEFLTSALQKGL